MFWSWAADAAASAVDLAVAVLRRRLLHSQDAVTRRPLRRLLLDHPSAASVSEPVIGRFGIRHETFYPTKKNLLRLKRYLK